MSYRRMKELREDGDLSQKDVADILYIHRTTYIKYETGAREIPFNLAVMLAEYYNVSLDYLAGRTANKDILK